jgi:hypothetical protein
MLNIPKKSKCARFPTVRREKQLFPQNGICAFAYAFLRDVLFVRWGCLANSTVSCLCAGGEKQNFFVSVSILFLQDNFCYLSSFS